MVLQANKMMQEGQQPQQPQNKEQANTMYRQWRQSLAKGGKKPTPATPKESQYDSDLKNFYIKACLHKDSVKTVS